MLLKNSVIATILMVLGAILINYTSHVEDIPPHRPFSTFPRNIDGWKGRTGRFSDKVYRVLGVEDSYLADYTAQNGDQINLYIGYYQSQREGDLIHSPKNCMPGAGWGITDSSLVEIRNTARPGNPKVKVIKLILENGSRKQIMLYWFHSRGRIISSEYWQKIYLVMDSVFRHRTDGSFVRLIAPVRNNNDKAALDNLINFSEQLMPILKEYIPS